MAIGIDDLYDEEEFVRNDEYISLNEPVVEEPSFIEDYLKTKGISDISKIKFEDDDGNILERSWNDLSREERINILNTPLEEPQQIQDNGLSDEELELVNRIRESNLSPNEYINLLNTPTQQESTYKIDDLSDDELFLLDLESRVGEMTDEEAVEALNNAKQNEDFYKKLIEGIRKEYREREDYQSQREQAMIEQEQQESYNKYKDSVISAIDNFNSVGNLDLNFEDSDKEYLAEFMLSQDENGNSYFSLALLDPETLVRAAWFILNGEEAFDSVSDYFINLIKLVSENQYKKGYEDGKKGSSKPSVVIDNSRKVQHRNMKTIEDLYDED